MPLDDTSWALIPYHSNASISVDYTPSYHHIPPMLKPSMGHVVHQEPEREVTITWPKYGALNKFISASVMMDGLHMTLSLSPSYQDVGTILNSMLRHDYKLMHPSCIIRDKHYTTDGSYEISGRSAFITDCSSGSCLGLLQTIQVHGFVERIFVTLTVSSGAHEEQDQLSDILLKNGFEMVTGGENLMTGNYESTAIYTVREAEHISTSSESQNTFDLLRGVLSFGEGQCFVMCLRDSDNRILGGVLATLTPHAFTPHAYINTVFIEESLRGMSYGKQLMSHTEEHIKETGYSHVLLGTSSAYKFYRSIGYEECRVYPGSCLGLDGESITSYILYKRLILTYPHCCA